MDGIKYVSAPDMPHTIAYWHRSDLEAELPDAAELEVMTLSCKKGNL